jgi:LEA14-like dessication related protein
MASPSRRSIIIAALALASQGCVMSAVMPGLIEAPQIQARAVQFLGANAGTATMRVELVGYNPNSFALYAANLRAEISVNGRSVGTVDATFSQVLPARRPLVVLVEVNVSRMGGAISGPVRVSPSWGGSGGPMVIEGAPQALPFRVDGALSFRSRYGDVSVPWGFQGAAQSSVFASW